MVVADVLEGVLTTISRYNMLRPGDRVIVAVSGGPDSICLLHVLLALAPRLGIQLTGVAHFNHHLRGEESDGDQRSVEQMADRLGLECFIAGTAAGSAAKGNLESRLRHERRRFFQALIAQTGSSAVALGHTRDDQAETVLFRLLRGTGLSGLSGILPATAEGIVRPLIGATRAQTIQFLLTRGIAWREDSSNSDPRFARNRIRHQLLPQLEREWNPRLRESLSHLADVAFEEERWWSRETRRLAEGAVQRVPAGIELHAGELAAQPRAAARRLIREAIRQAKGDLYRVDFRHVEAVIDLAMGRGRSSGRPGSGRIALPGLDVLLSFDWMLLKTAECAPISAIPVKAPGTYCSPGGNTLIHLWLSKPGPPPVPGSGAYATLKLHVPGSTAGTRLHPLREFRLRGWRAGDHYRPLGESRDRKLKEMFQRARVPSWRRPFWPILTLGDQIVWAGAFGPAAEFAANPETGVLVSLSERVRGEDGRGKNKNTRSSSGG